MIGATNSVKALKETCKTFGKHFYSVQLLNTLSKSADGLITVFD